MLKNILCFLFIILFSTLCVDAEVLKVQDCTVFKKIVFKSGEPTANNILYQFVKNTLETDLFEMANIKPNNVIAYSIDLNDDGQNEIIGLIYSSYYWSRNGWQMFILEYKNGHYRQINSNNFEPKKNVYILQNKKNGYRVIKSFEYNMQQFIKSGGPLDVVPVNLYYENGEYHYDYNR
ncbi:hypothetical protein IJ579_01045 [bacterium]|nr:hypothetical protein [bacterium]